MAAAGFSLSVSCLAQDSPLAPTAGSTPRIEGRIIAISGDHISIDVGDSYLKGGDIAVIKREGVPIGLAVVVWVDIGHTSMRVLSINRNMAFKSGDQAIFESQSGPALESTPAPVSVELTPTPTEETAAPQAPSPAVSTQSAQAGPLTVERAVEPFSLPPPVVGRKKIALTQSANVFHGRVRGWQLYQQVRGVHSAWYGASRLDADGSIERLFARPWSFVWSGNVTYRDASTASTADDFRHPKPHVYRLMLSRKNSDGGFLRLGRFFPMELPNLGYIDGGQWEAPVSVAVKLGGVFGIRPDRITQGFSNREKIVAAYGSLETGEPRRFYLASTLGAMHTNYAGKADELALFYDQRADLGPKLNMYGTSQFNFNAGAAQEHTKPRLTRANIMLNSPLTQWVSFRAGANHYEPIDANAERDLAGGNNNYINNGYWRYYGGSAQNLPWDIGLDEDLSFTNTQGQFSQGLWRVSLSRRGLPRLPDGFFSLTVYNLYNPEGPDYGATVSVSAPLFNAKLNLDGNAGYRYAPISAGARRFRASDFSVHANWRISDSWTADTGATQTFQEDIKSFMVNGGLSYRW